MLVGFLADRYEQRGLFNIGMSSIGALGFLIMAVSRNHALSYFAVFLGAGGIYPCISNTITWVSNNCDGVYRRGITVGAVIAWGNLNGGILSSPLALTFSDVEQYLSRPTMVSDRTLDCV